MKSHRLAILLFLLAIPYPLLLIAWWLEPGWVPGLAHVLEQIFFYGFWAMVAGIPVLALVYPPFGQKVSKHWKRFSAQLRADRAMYRELLTQIEHFPNATAFYRLGLYWQEQYEWDDSILMLQRALELDPDLLSARYRLALAYFETGQFQSAVQELETVVERERSHAFGEAILMLARALEEAGRSEDALERYREYLTYSGGRPEGCVRLGLLLERMGESGEARELYRRAIDHAEDAPEFTQGQDRVWSRQAQQRLRALGGDAA
ncbi:MAG: tetratricopeptide repeat protein [Planctomycetota bacterium]